MLQLLRGTSEAVAASNPKLEAGLPFFELDTQKLKNRQWFKQLQRFVVHRRKFQ